MFGATVVTHTAAAQNEDDGPNQPKPYGERKIDTVMLGLQWDKRNCLLDNLK